MPRCFTSNPQSTQIWQLGSQKKYLYFTVVFIFFASFGLKEWTEEWTEWTEGARSDKNKTDLGFGFKQFKYS